VFDSATLKSAAAHGVEDAVDLRGEAVTESLPAAAGQQSVESQTRGDPAPRSTDTRSNCFLGIDFGGTGIRVAIATAEGEILHEAQAPTPAAAGSSAVIDCMARLVATVQQATGLRGVACGIGVPGLVDRESGVVRFLPNLPGHWRGVPLGEELSRRIGCPVRMVNDVRAATLGELRFGFGRQSAPDRPLSMAFVSIGTGVGGGLVIDGRLRLGPLGSAGELGHQTIDPSGPLCGCGNRGCLEALASGPALTAAALRLMLIGSAPVLHERTRGNPAEISVALIGLAATAGDAGCREVIATAARSLAIGIANVVTIVHPDLVVLGGGVSELGEQLLRPIREQVPQRVRMFPANDIQIVRSQSGSKAGLLGAVAVALEDSV
jgi:glucokinase